MIKRSSQGVTRFRDEPFYPRLLADTKVIRSLAIDLYLRLSSRLLTQVWFSNRRAKWRREEKLRTQRRDNPPPPPQQQQQQQQHTAGVSLVGAGHPTPPPPSGILGGQPPPQAPPSPPRIHHGFAPTAVYPGIPSMPDSYRWERKSMRCFILWKVSLSYSRWILIQYLALWSIVW